jgi:hypothetical protein
MYTKEMIMGIAFAETAQTATEKKWTSRDFFYAGYEAGQRAIESDRLNAEMAARILARVKDAK